MASLISKSVAIGERVIVLHLGVNRFGRSAGSTVQIEHPSVSANHCEVVLTPDGVLVRDHGSAHGTFIDGARVAEARLAAGQVLRIGEVELLLESAQVTVAIPRFHTPRQSTLEVASNQALMCARHPGTPATHRCTGCGQALCASCREQKRERGGRAGMRCAHCGKMAEAVCSLHCGNRATHRCSRCHRVFCDACPRKLRRNGGKILKLCPACSQECVLICPRHPEARAFYRCTHCQVALCPACARRPRNPVSVAARTCPICRRPAHLFCPRHPEERATHYCTRCNEPLCPTCVQRLRGARGAILTFCVVCHEPAKPFRQKTPEKRSLLDEVRRRMPLVLGHKRKPKKPPRGRAG